MVGFITFDTKQEKKFEHLSWMTGMTIEEVRDLYQARYDDQSNTVHELYKKFGCIPYGLM